MLSTRQSVGRLATKLVPGGMLLAVIFAIAFVCSSPAFGYQQDPATSPGVAAPGPTAAAPAAEPSPPATVADVNAAKAEGLFAANNTWLLTSSALVLFMTVPGLAMFYGGLVRKKNVLSVIMQCMFLMGLMAVIWAVYGYSLSFGGSEPAIGNGDHLFMKGLFSEWKDGARTATPRVEDAAKNPLIFTSLHMLFQGMFFIITPGLICGAFAERMKFSAMVVFSILWGTLIYCPLCHWVWDGGYLAWGSDHAIAGGAIDFAGGTVVHISSGISALVCALVIGKRVGYGVKPMPPHNLTYTALGAGMLWVGWFGFNGGSELGVDDIAVSAFAATHFSAAAALLSWAGLEWILRGKPSMLGAASGAVAGLVVITPASGFVTPMAAIIMGLIGGAVCFFACTTIKNKFGYDDSLDVFGVHGVGGTVGAILTGVFATRGINDWGSFLFPDASAKLHGAPLGLVDGPQVAGTQPLIVGQLVATGITWGLAIVGSFVLLKIIDVTIGLRVSEQQEQEGLDVTQHGEEGYILVS